jgi:excisionase family DNA binding protein
VRRGVTNFNCNPCNLITAASLRYTRRSPMRRTANVNRQPENRIDPPAAGGPTADAALDLDALAVRVADRVAERLAAGAAQRYLTVRAAAAYSSLSEDSIRSLLVSGKLTALRPVAGRVLIDRRELDALLLSSTGRPRRGRGIRREEGGKRHPDADGADAGEGR